MPITSTPPKTRVLSSTSDIKTPTASISSAGQVAPSSSEPVPASDDHPLNPGSIVGIAIGSCLGIIGVLFTLAFLAIRRRRQIRQRPTRLPEASWAHDRFGDSGRPIEQLPVELENKPLEPRELAAQPSPTTAQEQSPSSWGRPAHVSDAAMSYVLVNEVPVEVAAEPVIPPTPTASCNVDPGH